MHWIFITEKAHIALNKAIPANGLEKISRNIRNCTRTKFKVEKIEVILLMNLVCLL